MNLLTANPDSKTWLIILLIAIAVITISFLIILIFIKKSKKPKRVTVNDEFITNLVVLLGDKDNIKDVNVDNGRLKITVDNLELVNLEGIKEIATSGVFVTGNIIKTLFRLDSITIKKEIESRL